MPPLKVHFVTLGCPKNEVDSDRMIAGVASSAYDVEAELHAADVVVVNTCAFIRTATEESVETVLELASDWKALRPGRSLIVAGCLASRYGADIATEMPEVDAFVPVEDEAGLVSLLESLSGVPAEASAGAPVRTGGTPSAYLQVSDGCYRRCSFCAIPYIRGGYRSRPLDDLAAEARLLAASGAKELVLVGQDISAYGRDLPAPGPSLADVVRALAPTEGLEWLRLMYVQPEGVTPELLEVMAEEPVVCRYLDLPLQHASREVLHRMGRTGSGDEFLRLLGVIRGSMPDIALRTSVIVGFPGETEEDFETLEDFLIAARFDYVGVFEYSAEDGTPAAQMPDQVPAKVKRSRWQRLRDSCDRIGHDRAAERVGETTSVLSLGVEDEEPVGRTRGQAPDVDGVVYLDTEVPAGSLFRARIVDAAAYDLFGEVL